MKVILAGSTGFIGREVLRQCLLNPSINSVIALSRKDLPVSDPKLKTVLVQDWTAYGPEVLQECEGAEGCIWSLGVKTSDAEIQNRVTLDYTMAAASAFSELQSSRASSSSSSPFRFVFASGILAVRDQSKAAWFASAARHVKGEAENRLLAFTAERKDAFDAFIVRPGGVLASTGGVAGLAVSLGAPAVGVQALAAVMVELALKGAGEKVWENKDLVGRGKELLKAQGEK